MLDEPGTQAQQQAETYAKFSAEENKASPSCTHQGDATNLVGPWDLL